MASWQGFGLGLLAGLTFSSNHVLAQITPDNTLGAEGSVVIPVDPINDLIGGGAVRDANLFHSFQDFNVGEGRGAFFANPVGIENIFSRVTGGNPSNIFGTLGVLGEANLFLLNPNGVLFGENASLNLQGSFFVSTANAIRFGDEGFFSATQPETPQLLRVNPDAFFFSMVAAQQNNAIENRGFLSVPEGESLVLLGGNIAPDAVSTGGILIDGGTLLARGGRVEIAGVGEVGSVGIEESNGSFDLSFPQGLARTDVSLFGGIVYTVGGGGGSITIYADDLTVGSKLADNAIELERSFLLAGIGQGLGSINTQVGDVTLDTTGAATVSGGNIVNLIFPGAIGKAGDINLRAESLSLTNGSQLNTSIAGQGTGGNLTVNVSESIEVIGSSADGIRSGIFANVNPEATGKGGNLLIETENLLVAEGAEVSASTFGKGNSGNLTVRATESVIVRDNGSNLSTQVNPEAEGNGGNLTIETGQLLVDREAKVSAATLGKGDAGNLTVRATESVIVSNGTLTTQVEVEGNGGNLTIETGQLLLENGGQVSVSTFGTGDVGDLLVTAEDIEVLGFSPDGQFPSGMFANVNPEATGQGGNLTIETETLLVSEGTQISASTFGKGDAGNLMIRATESVIVSGGTDPFNGNTSKLTTQVTSGGEGNAGNLTIETSQLLVERGGQVSASTFGTGDAGDLIVTAEDIQLIGSSADGQFPSGLGANVSPEATGKGGNLTIETETLLVSEGAEISASTNGKGDAGNLTVRATESVIVSGTDPIDDYSSNLTTRVSSEGEGNAGNLIIETSQLLVERGGQVSASTFGTGDAGDLIVTAEDIQIIGISALDSRVFSALDTSVGSEATGEGGNLTIETETLLVSEGAEISASTNGKGDAGNLTVRATESVIVSGTDPVDGSGGVLATQVGLEAIGKGGNLTIETGRLLLERGGQVLTSTFGRGDAGDLIVTAEDIQVIGSSADGRFPSGLGADVGSAATGNAGDLTITSGKLLLEDGAFISAESTGTGDAGDITITTNGLLSATDSDIRTNTTQSAGGAINITAEKVRLYGDSDIKTDVSEGAGGGGNINLTAESVVAFDDSDILAFAQDGKGGDINFNTPAFFGDNFRPAPKNTKPSILDNNNRVDVNASGAIAGDINLPDVSFIVNSLTQQQESLIDSEELLANSCIVRSQQEQPESTFFIVGKGGLPERPGDLQTSVFTLGTIRNLPTDSPPKKSSEWEEGDPIIEPQGVYRLPNGELVLSRECHQ